MCTLHRRSAQLLLLGKTRRMSRVLGETFYRAYPEYLLFFCGALRRGISRCELISLLLTGGLKFL
jgi:hypothetical protein